MNKVGIGTWTMTDEEFDRELRLERKKAKLSERRRCIRILKKMKTEHTDCGDAGYHYDEAILAIKGEK